MKKGIVNSWDMLPSRFSKNLLIDQIEMRLEEIQEINFKKMPILIFNYKNLEDCQ